ncbi:MAG: hypothetical protein ACR652_09155 [Methylocystis sp.]|uniref:hypothetical protein n=1 Tax=Methylocystis sp. TaxID=1911079 RepID=UPI003DA1D065
MSEQSTISLAVTIMGLSLAVLSYAIRDEGLGSLVYGSALLSASLSLAHWFVTLKPRAKGRRRPGV